MHDISSSLVGYAWSVTRKQRNRAVHSRNGNSAYGVVVKAIVGELDASYEKENVKQDAKDFYETLQKEFPSVRTITAEMAIKFIEDSNDETVSSFMQVYRNKFKTMMGESHVILKL